MSRCHSHTYQECRCQPGQCRALPAIEIMKQGNNKTAGRDSYLLIGLAVFVAITLSVSAKTGFDRQAKAYETARRV